MKAKLFYACLFIMFAAGVLGSSSVQREEPVDTLFLENVEALAHYEYDPMCPNGCLSDGDGCLCGIWHPKV